MANPSLEVGVLTDTGLLRGNNEDAFGCCPALEPAVLEQRGALYVVADGMGGYQAGEVASAYAVREVLQRYYVDPFVDVGTALQGVFHAAHEGILRESAQQPTPGMGTTIVAAVVCRGEVVVANVGDSPAYLIHAGQLQPLYQEHSWVAVAVATGLITAEQARHHPHRNVITRHLGMDRSLEVYVSPPTPLPEGDTVLLCSDGLTNVVPPEEAAGIAADLGRTAQEAAQALVGLARERGGPDNITVIVLRAGRPEGPAD